MKTSILIISAGALWLYLPGAWGQRIRLNEPTTGPISTGVNSKAAENISLPDEAMVEEEEGGIGSTEQVAINRTDTNPSNPPTEQPVPISAVLFDGSPGPKDCRGTAMLTIQLTKPGAQHSSPTCYNVPDNTVAQCGVFLANKDDAARRAYSASRTAGPLPTWPCSSPSPGPLADIFAAWRSRVVLSAKRRRRLTYLASCCRRVRCRLLDEMALVAGLLLYM